MSFKPHSCHTELATAMAKDLATRIKELEDEIKDPQSRLHVEGLLVSYLKDTVNTTACS